MQYSFKLTITGLTTNRMKTATVLCIFAMVAFASARPDTTYTAKYDGVDYVEAVNNDKLRHAYVRCLLGLGPCTAEAKELNSHMTDALETNCAKCTDKQKEGTEVVIKYMINNDVKNWELLKAKFDPEGKYSKKYEDRLKELKA